MWVKNFVLIFLVISIISCKSSKQIFDPNKTKKEFLVFGVGILLKTEVSIVIQVKKLKKLGLVQKD